MIFNINEEIAYLSNFFILNPGDLILTGTPDGVVNCEVGDVIVTSIEGVGDLINTLAD